MTEANEKFMPLTIRATRALVSCRRPMRALVLLVLGVTMHLSILAYFKYSNFFVGDRKSSVELLLVAPDFVLSKLEGRSRGGSRRDLHRDRLTAGHPVR